MGLLFFFSSLLINASPRSVLSFVNNMVNLIRKQLTPRQEEDGRTFLVPENPAYKPFEVENLRVSSMMQWDATERP